MLSTKLVRPLKGSSKTVPNRVSSVYGADFAGFSGFGGCWDVAAGALIVEEAGGKVLDPFGGPFNVMGRRVLAANHHIIHAAADVLKTCPVGSAEPAAPPS